MGFLGLCQRDPLVEFIRARYGATPLKVPEQRLVPLSVVANGKRKAFFRGDFSAALAGPPLTIQSKSSVVAGIEDLKTSSIKGTAGVPLLLDSLTSLNGVPLSGELKSHLSALSAAQFSFSFPQSRRIYVDIQMLGEELNARALAINPATAIFLREEDPYDLLVVDSVLVSSSFTVSLEDNQQGSLGAELKGSVSGTSGTVSGNLQIDASQANKVHFSSNRELAFAFSCVKLVLRPDGAIESIEPLTTSRPLNALPGATFNPPRRYLRDTPDLFFFDDESP